MATTPRKTFPELQALSAPLVDSDVVAVYRAPGPAKRTTASVLKTYAQTGLGTMATQNANAVAITGGTITGITDLAVADGGTGASDASGARTNLGVAIGTNVQAYDADLTAIAALTSAADKMPYATGAQTWALADLTSFARTLLATANNSAFLAALGQIASTAINFLQSGTGAVTRTGQAKLRDALHAKDFGVVGDGSTDDQAAMQAAITEAVASDKVLIIDGFTSEIRCNSGLTIAGPVHIRGGGKGVTRLNFVGTSGFSVSATVNDVCIEGLNIATSVRYTTTPNTYIGLNIAGTSGNDCDRIYVKDCFFDGWQDAIVANYAREPVFDGVETVYCYRGIWLKGQSTNWTITGSCRITGIDSTAGTPAAASTGVRVGDATSPQPEGGCIQPGCLIFGFARGFRNQGAINIDVIGVRLDAISEFGILDQSDNSALSANNNYIANFFGMIGGAGSIGIYSTNSTSTAGLLDQSRGTLIHGNEICIYSTKSVDYGILIEGSGQRQVTVSGTKRILGTVNAYACSITGGSGHKVHGNAWDTGGFATSVAITYGLNTGTIASGAANCIDAASIYDALSAYRVAGTKVIGTQGAAVADATDAASVIARLNDLLARCRAHGLIAT